MYKYKAIFVGLSAFSFLIVCEMNGRVKSNWWYGGKPLLFLLLLSSPIINGIKATLYEKTTIDFERGK